MSDHCVGGAAADDVATKQRVQGTQPSCVSPPRIRMLVGFARHECLRPAFNLLHVVDDEPRIPLEGPVSQLLQQLLPTLYSDYE